MYQMFFQKFLKILVKSAMAYQAGLVSLARSSWLHG
jgi:hypothetical protein